MRAYKLQVIHASTTYTYFKILTRNSSQPISSLRAQIVMNQHEYALQHIVQRSVINHGAQAVVHFTILFFVFQTTYVDRFLKNFRTVWTLLYPRW